MLGGTPSPRFPQEHLTGKLTVNLGTVLCAECYMGQSPSTREEAVDRFIEMCVWEKAMAPHSSTLAWKIPWTEEPGRLQSMGLLRVRHD